jgi:hypothetical protein
MTRNLVFEGVGSYTITDTEVTLDDGLEDIDVTENGDKIIFGRNTKSSVSFGSGSVVTQGNGVTIIKGGQGIHTGRGSQYNIVTGNVKGGVVGHNFVAGNMVNSVMGSNNVFTGSTIGAVSTGRNSVQIIDFNNKKRKHESSTTTIETGGSESVVFDGVKYKPVLKDGKKILVPVEDDATPEKKKKKLVQTYALKFSQVENIQLSGCCDVALDVMEVAKDLIMHASGNGSIKSKMLIPVKKVRVHVSGNASIKCTWDTEYLDGHCSGNGSIGRFHITDDGELHASGNAGINVTKDAKIRLSERSSGNANISCKSGTRYVNI